MFIQNWFQKPQFPHYYYFIRQADFYKKHYAKLKYPTLHKNMSVQEVWSNVALHNCELQPVFKGLRSSRVICSSSKQLASSY